MRSIFHKQLAATVLLCFTTTLAAAQGLDTAALVVHVQQASGGPLTQPALVRLISNISAGITTSTGQGGQAIISSLPAGDYTVEVSAAGYQSAREEVSILGNFGQAQVFVMLRPEGAAGAGTTTPAGASVLAGKSRKELDLAVAALAAGNAGEALKHISYPLKHASTNPDVLYVAGVCEVRQNHPDLAHSHFDAALKLKQDHLGAQLALGSLLAQQNKLADAILHLDKAASLDRNSWRAHWLLGDAVLRSGGDLTKAKFHITRAIELGKDKTTGALVTLAVIQARAGERDAGRATLDQYLHEHPQDPNVAMARNLLDSPLLSRRRLTPGTGVPAATPTPEPLTAPTAAALPAEIDAAILDPLMPPDIDASVPAVTPGVACALPQVLEGTARRAVDFADGLERFSATEDVVHEELDTTGRAKRSNRFSFDYVAALQRPRPDTIVMDEYRNGSSSAKDFPAIFAVQGLPGHWLIFDRRYAADYDFTCEGLGSWRAQPAWQVHFEQKSDREGRILAWDVKSVTYPVSLKGRAWIAAGSFQLLHMETDLVAPMDAIRLRRNHIAIDYAPVKSAKGGNVLWLPSAADIYTHFRGRLFRLQHAFSKFTLFNVDSAQKISDPKQGKEPQTP